MLSSLFIELVASELSTPVSVISWRYPDMIRFGTVILLTCLADDQNLRLRQLIQHGVHQFWRKIEEEARTAGHFDASTMRVSYACILSVILGRLATRGDEECV